MLQRVFKVLDPFLVILVSVVLLASFLPCRGEFAHVMGYVTDFAIGLLFFTHGAKLSREAVFSGIGHWRLHLLVLASTFILFPVLGLSARALTGSFVNPTILAGVVFLCLLPSTVQSSIAFTAIAGGNLPAAICSATLSNILGVFITPALVGIFLSTGGGAGGGAGAGDAIKSIAEQLLCRLPLGHWPGLLDELQEVIRGQQTLPGHQGFGRPLQFLLEFLGVDLVRLVVDRRLPQLDELEEPLHVLVTGLARHRLDDALRLRHIGQHGHRARVVLRRASELAIELELFGNIDVRDCHR